MKNIVVLGGGVLGSQIAFQTAYMGFNVTIWLRSENSIGHTQPKLDELKETYTNIINTMDPSLPKDWCHGIASIEKQYDKNDCLSRVNNAYKNVKIELDLSKALKDADLVIESVSEEFDDKKNMYKMIAPLLDDKTIVVTNSSTILPSKLAKYTGRPDRFLALHFANSIWKNTTAEVMAQDKTDKKCFDEVG